MKDNGNPKEIVKDLVSRYTTERPTRISLRLYWNENRSEIGIEASNLKQKFEYPLAIDFTSFAHGVIDAYKEAYGEFEVVPVSFREEIYKNDQVSLDLYPTGSAGVFDIFVRYK